MQRSSKICVVVFSKNGRICSNCSRQLEISDYPGRCVQSKWKQKGFQGEIDFEKMQQKSECVKLSKNVQLEQKVGLFVKFCAELYILCVLFNFTMFTQITKLWKKWWRNKFVEEDKKKGAIRHFYIGNENKNTNSTISVVANGEPLIRIPLLLLYNNNSLILSINKKVYIYEFFR